MNTETNQEKRNLLETLAKRELAEAGLHLVNVEKILTNLRHDLAQEFIDIHNDLVLFSMKLHPELASTPQGQKLLEKISPKKENQNNAKTD